MKLTTKNHTPTTQNILLTLSYNGKNFFGWQKQLDNGIEISRTVQGELEKALKKILKKETKTFAAGRTDAGVHALAQTVNFFSENQNMQPANFIPALNSILPQDIRIMHAQAVPHDFHARFSAAVRNYRYYLKCSKQIFAHQSDFYWHIRRYPNIQKLNAMLAPFWGEIDCAAFSTKTNEKKSTFRYIHHAHFFYHQDDLIFEIAANAFLWKMVRSILGTLLLCEKENRMPQSFMHIVNEKNRQKAGPTAPPQGLFLYRVDYPKQAFYFT